MGKFINVFTEKDKEYLIQNGYTLLNAQKNGDTTIYIFKNDSNKMTFSEKDRGRFLFTNILTF